METEDVVFFLFNSSPLCHLLRLQLPAPVAVLCLAGKKDYFKESSSIETTVFNIHDDNAFSCRTEQ